MKRISFLLAALLMMGGMVMAQGPRRGGQDMDPKTRAGRGNFIASFVMISPANANWTAAMANTRIDKIFFIIVIFLVSIISFGTISHCK